MRQVGNDPSPDLSPGTRKCGGERFVSGETSGEVGHSPRDCISYFPPLRPPPDQFVRGQQQQGSPSLLLSEKDRSQCSRPRCLSPSVAIPTSLCVSPTAVNSSDSGETHRASGRYDSHHSSLAGGSLVGGGGSSLDVPPSSPPDIGAAPAVKGGPQGTSVSGLAIMCQRIEEIGVDPALAEFIMGSIRKSSVRTYESAWRTWCTWCTD